MFAFSQSVSYFYVPGDLQKADVKPGTRIRLGGLVKTGSWVRGEGTTSTLRGDGYDFDREVTYTGILPDLFREGQGGRGGRLVCGWQSGLRRRHGARQT